MEEESTVEYKTKIAEKKSPSDMAPMRLQRGKITAMEITS